MLYRDDPAWADVPKVPQDDGPNPIVSIAYSSTFTDVMDCFRGVLQTNELSERTLSLSKDVIYENPANYTAWAFRRRCLEALDADLAAELEFIQEMALAHPKNYQIWHHRREVCTLLGDGSKEAHFCAMALSEDAKNYHAWAHRQWYVRRFELYDGEFEFIDSMLQDDVRNNSAWNHRWFMLSQTTNLDVETRKRELDYAMAKLDWAIHNESAWNYIRALWHGFHHDFKDLVQSKCQQVLQSDADCIFPAILLVDLYAKEGTSESITQAQTLLKTLMNETDRVRAPYYRLRLNTLQVQ